MPPKTTKPAAKSVSRTRFDSRVKFLAEKLEEAKARVIFLSGALVEAEVYANNLDNDYNDVYNDLYDDIYNDDKK